MSSVAITVTRGSTGELLGVCHADGSPFFPPDKLSDPDVRVALRQLAEKPDTESWPEWFERLVGRNPYVVSFDLARVSDHETPAMTFRSFSRT